MNPKSRLNFTLGATVGLALLLSVGSARAVTYTEIGDAGQNLSSAQGTAFPNSNFGQSLTSISGVINPSVGGVYDADLYRIFITNTSLFSATTVGGSSLDTVVFLFDSAGRAVIANDDANGFTLQSNLPAGNATLSGLSPGIYYIGIALSGGEPVNSVNQLLFNTGNTTDVRTAAPSVVPPTVADFSNNVFFNESGAYTIALTSVTAVPEPSTWALMGAGAVALGLGVCRRNRAARVVAAL